MFSRSIDVLVADLTAVPIDEDMLSVTELGRALRIGDPALLTEYLAAHTWVRRRLADYLECTPGEIRFETGEHGKPSIAAPATDLTFNFAYSAWTGVLAVGFRQALGVDIEKVTGDGIEPGTMDRLLAPMERDVVIRSLDRERASLRFWVRKEALAKATGLGVSLDSNTTDASGLSPISLAGFEITDLNLGDDVVAAVATRPGTAMKVALDMATSATDSGRSDPQPVAVAV